MRSVLFSVFGFPIHSYGVMLALSFLFGIWLSSYRARRMGLDPRVIPDVGFWLILSSIIGARAYYVILHFEEFRGNLYSIVNPFQNGSVGIGGLVLYGGLLGAIACGLIFFRVKKLPFLPYADAIAPGIGFGVFLTRIGCFLNGCCYGEVNSSALSVCFPVESAAGFYQHSIHATGLFPSQLAESIGGLIIGFAVLTAGRIKAFSGFQFYLICVLYALLRFGIDFTRVYGAGERLGHFSHNQVLCIIILIVGIVIMAHGFLKQRRSADCNI